MKFLTSLRTMLSMLLLLPLMAVAQIESGKVYMFMNEGNAGKAMTPGSGSNVTIATANENNVSHRWYVEEAGSSFRVRSMGTGMYLRSSGATSQNWTLVDTPDANCTLDVKAVGDAFTLCAKGNTNTQGYMHYGAGTGTIVCWGTDTPATLWTVVEVPTTAEELEQNWKELDELNFTTEEYNAWKAALSTLFKDKACTQLADAYATYTKAQMEADANYQVLPKDLKNMMLKMTVDGTWDEANIDANKPQWDAEYAKRLRVQLVEPYCSKEEAAAVLHMNAHTNYNNPLGIYANGRQFLYIMVEGSIEPGATLYLATWTGHNKPGGKTDGYKLVEGLNIIPNFAEGMTGCINYVVNAFNAGARGNAGRQMSLKAFKDIKVHIEGGNLNGFFNLMGDELWGEGDDNADWDYYAARATHTAMPMLGQYMTLQFPFFDEDCVSMDKEGNVEGIGKGLNTLFTGKNIAKQSLIEWDNVMLWERLVMGLASKEEVARANATWKSPYSGKDEVISHTGHLTDGYASDYEDYYRIHGLAFGVPTGYMYGSWDHSGYNYNTMEPILVNMLTDSGSHWGPGHEIGHQHQEPFTLNGLMEVTNNLFSNVVLWYFGKSTSRVNGDDGMLERIAKAFNQKDGDFYTNNIWGLTHMYFRLFLYYHVLGHNTAFYPRLYEMMRQNHMERVSEPGIQTGRYGLLHFYKMTCQAAGEDLTEFFRAHGLLTPMNERFVGDYSNSIYTSTPEEINEAIAWVKAKGWKENLTPLFINDGTGQPAKGSTGEDLEHYDLLNGQNWITAHVGHYAYFYEPATEYTFEVAPGGTINFTGEGGVGFLIRNDEGELLAFSNKKTMYISDEVSMKLINGEVKIEVINGDGTIAEVKGDIVAGMRTLLKDAIDRADAMFELDDKSYNKVGFYRYAYLTELEALLPTVKDVYANEKSAEYASAYISLFAMLEAVDNNKDAFVKFFDGAYYQLTTYNNKKLAANAAYTGEMTAENSKSSKAQHWYFEKTGDSDVYYIRNRYNNKYVGVVENGQQILANSETPVAFKVIMMEQGVFALQCQEGDQKAINANPDSRKVLGWGHEDTNSWWYITAKSIGDAELAEIQLNDLVNRTKGTLTEMGKSVILPGQLPLQVNDAAAQFYLSSNADQNTIGTSKVGDGLSALLDNSTSTFFHSYCDGTEKVTAYHNLTVDLGNGVGLSQFTFSYALRNAASASQVSAVPTQIRVSGSNNSLDYTKIKDLRNTSDGLPAYSKLGQYWYSDTITAADTTYRYLRFEVLRSAGPDKAPQSYGGRACFAISEFAISSPITFIGELKPEYQNLVEIYTETAEEMQSATVVLNNSQSTADDIYAATAALQEKYDALLAARKDPSAITGVELDALGKGGIYDVSGRRVNNITAPGLYIVNGQKRLVK